MKLKSIKFENFRHFHDQIFEFKSGINALIGDNNAGKTSLLFAIAGVFGLPYGGTPINDFPTKFKKPPFTTRVEIEVLFTKKQWTDLIQIRNIDVNLNQRFKLEDVEIIANVLATSKTPLQLRMDIESINNVNIHLKYGNYEREKIKILKPDLISKFFSKFEEKNRLKSINEFTAKYNANLLPIINQYINKPPNLPYKPIILLPYLSELNQIEKFLSYQELQSRQTSQGYKGHLIKTRLFHLKRTNEKEFFNFKTRLEENFPSVENVNIDLNYETGNIDLYLDKFERDLSIYGGGTQSFTKIFSTISFQEVDLVLIKWPL